MWLCFLFPTPAASSEPCSPPPHPPTAFSLSLDSHWSIALTWKNTHPAATAFPPSCAARKSCSSSRRRGEVWEWNEVVRWSRRARSTDSSCLSPLFVVTCALIDCCESDPPVGAMGRGSSVLIGGSSCGICVQIITLLLVSWCCSLQALWLSTNCGLVRIKHPPPRPTPPRLRFLGIYHAANPPSLVNGTQQVVSV